MNTDIKETHIQWKEDYPIFANERFLTTLNKRIVFFVLSTADSRRWILPCVERTGVLRIIQARTRPFELETGRLPDGETERHIYSTFIRHVRKHRDIIAPMSVNALTLEAPPDSYASPIGTVVVNLSLDEDAIWKGIHSKHRNVIRKAKSMGLTVETAPEYFEGAYNAYRASQERSGNHIIAPVEYRRLYEAMNGNAIHFAAVKDSQVHASALILFSRFSSYYLYGGSMATAAAGAANLVHWEAMKTMKALGIRRYDFMGVRLNPHPESKYAGIKRFKERFGGALETGYIWEMGLSPWKYRAWRLLKRMKR